MEQKSINFRFKGRYFQSSPITENTRHIIFVLHGYGQQAKYFINKFTPVERDDTSIIAPEGLSKFYLQGFSGRVGATWMTKEDRLADIENYVSYLSALRSEILQDREDIKISIVGFSQGAATASRWVIMSDFHFDQLILWAGVFPPDMDFEEAQSRLRDKKIYYVYGLQDPFLTEERMIEMKQLSKKIGVKPDIISFEGEHDIYEAPLKKIFL